MVLIKSQKTASVEMLEVIGTEESRMTDNNSSISVSEFDKEHTYWASEDIVGYIAGDVNLLLESETNTKGDYWFVAKKYFEDNYKKI